MIVLKSASSYLATNVDVKEDTNYRLITKLVVVSSKIQTIEYTN